MNSMKNQMSKSKYQVNVKIQMSKSYGHELMAGREGLKSPLPSRGEGWVRGVFGPIDPHPRLLPIQGEGIDRVFRRFLSDLSRRDGGWSGVRSLFFSN